MKGCGKLWGGKLARDKKDSFSPEKRPETGAKTFIEVGGLANEEHIDWVKQKPLQVGDEICVKIVESGSADEPVRRRRNHPAETLKAKKRYVRKMAKELGGKLRQSPDDPDCRF